MSQAIIVLLIVALASGYVLSLVFRAVRSARQSKEGCGSSCGCDAPSIGARAR